MKTFEQKLREIVWTHSYQPKPHNVDPIVDEVMKLIIDSPLEILDLRICEQDKCIDHEPQLKTVEENGHKYTVNGDVCAKCGVLL